MSTLIQNPTRILFFTGKGGVGKTSAACATAIGLADAGKRVLLVSTDPASNLDEVLGVKLSATPTAVPNVPGLSALNIDPEQAAHDYRERVVGPYRGVLPAAAVASMEEQLSGACTVEIAAFDEFSKLLGDKAATAAVRPRHLRHRADRAHAAPARAARGVVELPRRERRRDLVPRSARRPERAEGALRGVERGAPRSRADDPGLGRAARALVAHRGRAHAGPSSRSSASATCV